MLGQYPETDAGGVDFVKHIFIGLGGTEVPPRRPGHRDISSGMSSGRHSFLMDFENACLMEFGSYSYPTGPHRHADPAWSEFIKAQVYPHHSDVDWSEYVAWVEAGFGDDYFLEEGGVPSRATPSRHSMPRVWSRSGRFLPMWER